MSLIRQRIDKTQHIRLLFISFKLFLHLFTIYLLTVKIECNAFFFFFSLHILLMQKKIYNSNSSFLYFFLYFVCIPRQIVSFSFLASFFLLFLLLVLLSMNSGNRTHTIKMGQIKKKKRKNKSKISCAQITILHSKNTSIDIPFINTVFKHVQMNGYQIRFCINNNSQTEKNKNRRKSLFITY